MSIIKLVQLFDKVSSGFQGQFINFVFNKFPKNIYDQILRESPKNFSYVDLQRELFNILHLFICNTVYRKL